jgi:hypothetical protein
MSLQNLAMKVSSASTLDDSASTTAMGVLFTTTMDLHSLQISLVRDHSPWMYPEIYDISLQILATFFPSELYCS